MLLLLRQRRHLQGTVAKGGSQPATAEAEAGEAKKSGPGMREQERQEKMV